jgi:hypothetical protein
MTRCVDEGFGVAGPGKLIPDPANWIVILSTAMGLHKNRVAVKPQIIPGSIGIVGAGGIDERTSLFIGSIDNLGAGRIHDLHPVAEIGAADTEEHIVSYPGNDIRHCGISVSTLFP